MTIQEYTDYVEKDVLPLYASVGWTAYTDHPDPCVKAFHIHCSHWLPMRMTVSSV